MSYVVLATVNAQGVTDSRRQTLHNVQAALPGVAVAGLQEVKNLTRRWSLRDRLSRRTLGVAQVTDTPATAGVAIVWDRSRIRPVKGSQRIALGVEPHGQRMLSRYLLAIDLVLDDCLIVTAIAAHRPKAEFRELWPAFDAALARMVRLARHPVIVFTDNNSTAMPSSVRGLLKPYARRIDMILLDQRLDALGQAFDLPRTGSDHRPVGLRLALPGGTPRTH